MSAIPEILLVELLRDGVAAIEADPGVLDEVFSGLEAYSPGELAKIKAFFARRSPEVTLAYPRASTQFPCFAVVLAGERTLQDYMGQGFIPHCEEEGGLSRQEGFEYRREVQVSYNVYVYAEHPDVTTWMYRIARAIINVGTTRLIVNENDDPQLEGADLMPDKNFGVENLFVRRLTVKLDITERWTDTTSLWRALNGEPTAFVSPDTGSIEVSHADGGGGVTPYKP